MGTRFSDMLNSEPTFILPLDSARPEPLGPRPSIVPQLDLTRSPQGNIKRKLRPARSIFREPSKEAGDPHHQPAKGVLIEVAMAAAHSELCPAVDAEESEEAHRATST